MTTTTTTSRPATGTRYDHIADVPTTVRAVTDRDAHRWERHPQRDDQWTALSALDGSPLGYHGPDLTEIDEWAPFTPATDRQPEAEPVNHDAQVLRDFAALTRINGRQIAAAQSLPDADVYERMAQTAEYTATHLEQHGLTMAKLLASGQAGNQ